MPVPSKMADLFTIAASNSPAGSDLIGNSLDDYLRATQAILRSTNALASASISAASTTDLSTADGESVQITGSATISSLGTAVSGLIRECRFAASCVLTASTAIVLPNSANITTTAGDVITFRSLGAGNWTMVAGARVLPFLPLSGGTLTGTLGLAPGGTSSPEIDLNKSTSAQNCLIRGQTGGQNRWTISFPDSSSENFIIYRYNLAGAFVDQPFILNQATGQLSLTVRPVFSGNVAWDAGNFNPANYAPLAGATFTGNISAPGVTGQTLSAFTGTVGTQQVLGNWGWSNAIPRWKPVIETDASFSLWAYDTAGSPIAQRFNVTQAGICKAVDFQATSDLRLKEDVSELKRGIEALRQVAPIEYTLFGERSIGFSAQAVQKIAPEAVSEGTDGFLRLSHGQLLAIVARAVLDLDERLTKAGL